MLLNMSKNKSLTDIISETNEKICYRLDTTNELLTKILAQLMKNQEQESKEKEPQNVHENEPEKIDIGKKIRTIRLNKGLMSVWLARKIGKCDSYIATIETGKARPSKSAIEKLEKALGTKLGEG